MLDRIFNLINTLEEILLAESDIYSVDFKSICLKTLSNDIDFGIYSETHKGFLISFRSKNTKILKDVITPNEISKSPTIHDDNTVYADLLVFTRKFHKKIIIRLALGPLDNDQKSLINKIIKNFYSFQEMYDKNYVFQELLEILKETTEVDNIEEVIEKTTGVTKKLLATQASSILLKDEKKNELYFKVVDSEKSDKIKEIRIPVTKGIAGYTARTGEPLIVNDVANHPDFYNTVDEKSGFTTRSIMSAPIKPLNRIIGVIEAINKIRGTDFSEDDLNILKMTADILGINLINSMLYEKLNDISSSIIKSLITALEARDEYTKGHSYRVQIYSVKLAKALGLPAKKVKQVELSAILHDIGKIGIPDSILRKPGGLTDEEYETIKKHPVIGYNILKSIDGLDDVLDGIKYHHERYDGKGYPEGLEKDEIPLVARIIAIADTLDAITSDRPYRKGLDFEYALEQIRNAKGSQLDPELVDVFLNSFTNLEELKLVKLEK
ncbi:MAG: HD domain-containing protein [Spirochaetes bacterium]|nr:HD domain-containing protein [Spirochaetota bacterium]